MQKQYKLITIDTSNGKNDDVNASCNDNKTLPLIPNRKDLFYKAQQAVNLGNQAKLSKLNRNRNRNSKFVKKDSVFERLDRKMSNEMKKTIRILNQIHMTNREEHHERSVIDNWNTINAQLNTIHCKINFTSRDKDIKIKKNPINNKSKENRIKKHKVSFTDTNRVDKNIKLVMVDLYKAFINHKHNTPHYDMNPYNHQVTLTEPNKIVSRPLPLNFKKNHLIKPMIINRD